MYIFKNIITAEAGKRNGKPCIRGMRITVENILAALEFSANRAKRTLIVA